MKGEGDKMRKKGPELPEKSPAEKVMDAFQLPKNKSGIITALHITGVHEAIVEGHRGIIEYTSEVIRLNTPQFIMKISGAELEITAVAEEYIELKGLICGVEYLF